MKRSEFLLEAWRRHAARLDALDVEGQGADADAGILLKWAIRHLLAPDCSGFQRHLTKLGECDWEAFFEAVSEMRFSPSQKDSCAATCRSGPARMWEVQG